MVVFVDTSAIMALIHSDDACHARAVQAYAGLRDDSAALVTTSYVMLETVSLVQRRMSVQASIEVGERILRGYTVQWVDELLHRAGWLTYREQARRLLSLVDCVSFATMKAHSIRRAFAYDDHFRAAGFELIG